MKSEYQGYRDLKVYQLAYKMAMEIFELTKNFPSEEKYSLVDQIRRSSRSVPVNIREGFAKRRYPYVFVRHLNDASVHQKKPWHGLNSRYDANIYRKQSIKSLSKSIRLLERNFTNL